MVQAMLVLLLVFTIFLYWTWRQQSPRPNEPPRASGRLPLLGYAHQIIGDMSSFWRFIQKLTDESLKLGTGLTISFGPLTKIYVLTDPDECLQVANTCLEKSNYYEFGREWVGNGLITSNSAIWKHHRKMVNPAFNQAALVEFLGAFNRQAARLVEALAVEADGRQFDSLPHMENSALETICLTALRIDFNDTIVLDGQYLRALKQMYDIFVKRIRNVLIHHKWCFSLSSLKREQDQCIKILHNVTNSVIQKKRNGKNGIITSERLTEIDGGFQFRSFAEILLERETSGDALTDVEIREELDTIIAAAVDTTSTTLTYILIFLGTYTDVQEKLCIELEEIFGKSDRPVDKSDLKNLVYTEAVIKESMRLLPIIPYVMRYIDRDVKLKNHKLYAGNECMISLYGINRHPALWGPDAHEFRPERFLDPAAVPRHPAAIAGFSFGKRSCIGKAYSMMFMKTAVAHMCRQYTVAADYHKLVLKLGIQIRPVSGHHISITKKT